MNVFRKIWNCLYAAYDAAVDEWHFDHLSCKPDPSPDGAIRIHDVLQFSEAVHVEIAPTKSDLSKYVKCMRITDENTPFK